MSTDTLRWYPWSATGCEADTMRDAWYRATLWLDTHGIRITEPPDAMAYTDMADVYAFRIDSGSDGSITLFVHIDADGAPDGHTAVERVEVVRCEAPRPAEPPPPALDRATGRMIPW